MRLADLYGDIESIAALGTTFRNPIKRALRSALEHYASVYPWPHYKDRNTIALIAPYSTGTVAVTAASATVTGTSTVWTSAMVGRKIRINNEIPWYDISAVGGATSITLTQNYQGNTQSGVTYSIFQDEYRLVSDVHQLLDVLQIQFGLPMVAMSYLDFDAIDTMSRTANDPILVTVLGRLDDRYTTGTVTGLVNGTTVTGTGTSWTTVAGLSKGSRFSVTPNSEVYTVKSVDSDTQLTIYEAIGTAFSGAAYTIYLNNIRVAVKQPPSAARNLYYRYHRIPYPLVNDYDEPDMPREFHYMLVWAGLAVAWEQKGNLALSSDAETRFGNWVREQIQALGTTMPNLRLVKNSMDKFWPTPLPPSYPPSYGVPLSMR